MTMKILKVTDNGTGFGPRGKACMNMYVDVPAESPTHMRLMYLLHMASDKKEDFSKAMDGFGAVSYYGDKTWLRFAYAPRYSADEDVMDTDIVSGEKFVAEAEKVYNDIMSYKNVVDDVMKLRERMLKTFSHVSISVYHTETGPVFNVSVELSSDGMTNLPPELMLKDRPYRAYVYDTMTVGLNEGENVSDGTIDAYRKRLEVNLVNDMYLRVAMEYAMPLLEQNRLRWHSCDNRKHMEKPFTLKICGDDFYKTLGFERLSGPELLALVKSWTTEDFEKMREQLSVKPIPPAQPRTPISEEARKLNSNIRHGKKRLESDYLNLVSFVNNLRVRNP